MISVIAWMWLFGTKLLPIQEGVLTLAGCSIAFELVFEFAMYATFKHYNDRCTRKHYDRY